MSASINIFNEDLESSARAALVGGRALNPAERAYVDKLSALTPAERECYQAEVWAHTPKGQRPCIGLPALDFAEPVDDRPVWEWQLNLPGVLSSSRSGARRRATTR
jgi:hypothetical protein